MDKVHNQLFFKVWRNIYINSQIFKHLKYFKIANTHYIHTLNSLNKYYYKSYLTKLKIKPRNNLQLHSLPYGSISNFVEYLNINDNIIFSIVDIPQSVTTLILDFSYRSFLPINLPNSIKKLKLHINVKVSKETILPNSLEYLELCNKNQVKVLLNQNIYLPNLTTLNLAYSDRFTKIPESTKILKFIHNFNNDLPNIPNGVEEIEFGNSYRKINFFHSNQSFPKTIKKLILGSGIRVIPKKLRYFKNYPELEHLECYISNTKQIVSPYYYTK